MDADSLRLILILFGALLLLGIFLWERHKRSARGPHARRRTEPGPAPAPTRVEPTLGGDGGGSEPADDAPRETLDQTLAELGDLVEEERRPPPKKPQKPRPAKRKEKRERLPDPEESRQQDLFAEDATVEGDHFRRDPAELPVMILQINIHAKDSPFEGPDILRAVQGVGMEPGDMHIFHRREDQDTRRAVLFSMASMVEPGSFPLDDMSGFRTPGLTLFARLPGPRDGLAVFSDMLFSAERLATELAGELQDETHSRLTKQTIEHLRSQILEHRRRVQLAKSKLGR